MRLFPNPCEVQAAAELQGIIDLLRMVLANLRRHYRDNFFFLN